MAKNNFQVTDQMVRILKRMEGFSEKSYIDASGMSIGYGHFLKAGEEALKGKTLSKEDADALLEKDIQSHGAAGISNAKVPLSQNQITALTLLAYNAGPGAAKQVVELLNQGKDEAAADKFDVFIHAYDPNVKEKVVNKQLVARRAFEKQLFTTKDGDPFDEGKPRPDDRGLSHTGVRTTAQITKSQGIMQASVFSGTPDAAMNENQRILAALRDLNAELGAREHVNDEALNRVRREGRGQA